MGFIEQTSSRSPRTFRGALDRPPPFPLSSLSIVCLPDRRYADAASINQYISKTTLLIVARQSLPCNPSLKRQSTYVLINNGVDSAQIASSAAGRRAPTPIRVPRDYGLNLTMEDPNVFVAPLSVLVTYRRLLTRWQEQVCAENPVEHYEGEWIGLPRADLRISDGRAMGE
jgi:hypothetical protein